MPPRNEQVATMVRNELQRNPEIDNEELMQKARGIDRKVGRLKPRQFHATYRLPALRSLRPAGAPTPAKKAAAKTAPKTTAKAASKVAPAAPAPTPTPTPAPVATAPAAAPTAETPTPNETRKSTALARPHAAEREAVRQILHLVAREALATEDRTSFIRLLDSLDERAAVILGIFGRV